MSCLIRLLPESTSIISCSRSGIYLYKYCSAFPGPGVEKGLRRAGKMEKEVPSSLENATFAIIKDAVSLS